MPGIPALDITGPVARENIAGAQFHPERSGAVGARFLRNFLSWNPA